VSWDKKEFSGQDEDSAARKNRNWFSNLFKAFGFKIKGFKIFFKLNLNWGHNKINPNELFEYFSKLV
jgi:hypothetical protein